MSKTKVFTVTHSRLSRSYQTLVLWLKRKRVDASLTMRNVGDGMNVPHSMIGKIENRERNLSVVEYIMYCDAVGADPVEGIQLILQQVRSEFNQQKIERPKKAA